MKGFEGNDTMKGMGGFDYILGGDGEDVLWSGNMFDGPYDEDHGQFNPANVD